MMRFLALACALCRQDLQDRFAGSLLGGLWIFIWPLVQLFIYIIIFGRLMGARLGMTGDVYAYGFYIASGLLCWTAFSSSLSRCSRCLLEKRHIISKVPVNLAVFPAAICLVELIPFAAGFALLFIADLMAGWQPQWGWLAMLPVALVIQLAITFGLGLFFACMAVFMRDVAEACNVALQMAFWFTPIVYLPSILPDWLQNILWINPMTAVTGIFQQCFVLGGTPPWPVIAYALAFGAASLALGQWIMRRWRKDILDAI